MSRVSNLAKILKKSRPWAKFGVFLSNAYGVVNRPAPRPKIMGGGTPIGFLRNLEKIIKKPSKSYENLREIIKNHEIMGGYPIGG